MNLEQANLIVDSLINSAQEMQNLAHDEDDHEVKTRLLAEAARQSQAAAGVLHLPLSI